MQVVFNATLSRLCRGLEIYICPLTPWFKICTSVLISTLVPIGTKLAYEITPAKWLRVQHSRYHCS